MDNLNVKTLSLKEKSLFNQFHRMPNGEAREKIYKKWKVVYTQITNTITADTKQPTQLRTVFLKLKKQ